MLVYHMTTTFAEHKKAHFLYEIHERYTAGIVLHGSEVKSIRAKKVDLSGSYILIREGEAWLLNTTITPYQKTNITTNQAEVRTRKILLHKKEIREIQKELERKGLTAVPLSLFEENGHVKLSLAVVKGKKIHDKRETIKKRDLDREEQRFYKK
jgi:SsrA-binding protein